MTSSTEFDRFLAAFATHLQCTGVKNHSPQADGRAAEFTDLLLTQRNDTIIRPIIALHLERWESPESDAREFHNFASEASGPHNAFWLYVRLNRAADLVVAARHLARFIELYWLRTRRPQRVIAIEIERRGWNDIILPPANSYVRQLRDIPANVGTIVGITTSGCWIGFRGERYWAFRGSFCDLAQLTQLNRLIVEAMPVGGVSVAFRQLVAGGERFATDVTII